MMRINMKNENFISTRKCVKMSFYSRKNEIKLIMCEINAKMSFIILLKQNSKLY